VTPFARLFVPVACVVALFGAAMYSLAAPTTDPVLAPLAGSRVALEGVVVRDPDWRESSGRLTVLPERINGSDVRDTKRVLVVADRFTDVSYGDRIHAEGVVRAPEAFETDTGRTFDYPKYLWAHGISHEIAFANIEVRERGAGNWIVSGLLAVKHTLVYGIERALPEPHAALAEGLLLGEKQSLGDRLYDAFVASGLVHIIVLSGYNVALVINAILFISLRVLPRMAGYGIAAVSVVGFAIMTGASETTVRAAVMALFMMTARVLRRPAAALRGLLIASALMALWNPFLVLYDLSFQLSILATFGLIVFSDGIAVRMRFIPKTFGLREIVSTTLATQITVLPLLVLSIGAVSLVFLPANVLVLPAVPVAMLASFTAAMAALLLPFAAFPFSLVSYGILAYIVSVSVFFGTLPFALVELSPGIAWGALGIITLAYAIVGFLFVRRSFKRGSVLRLSRHSDS